MMHAHSAYGGILCVLGTRPEAIKLAPVLRALDAAGAGLVVCLTGQHPELARAALTEFGIVPDFDLGLFRPGQTSPEFVAAALPPLACLMTSTAPALVVVHGDTASTLAAALAARYARLPLAHVEAGLRSVDPHDPFPEDMHRRTVAQLATLHLAPTETARAALRAEGIADTAIHVTGNPVIDAFDFATARLAADAPLRGRIAATLPVLDPARPLLLVTAHRRENHGPAMHGIADAIATLAARGDLEIVIPVHPNPAAGGVLRARLGAVPGVTLVPPLGYFAFVTLLRRARAVLTDSGGVQEEALACGCPVLVMRTSTERPEGVDAGTARIVGTDPARIVAAVRALVDDDVLHARMTACARPYGDGDAAARIAAVLYPSAPVSTASPRVAA